MLLSIMRNLIWGIPEDYLVEKDPEKRKQDVHCAHFFEFLKNEH